MTTHKEALKLALEALEREARGYAVHDELQIPRSMREARGYAVHDELQIPRSMRDAITAIKEALAQPEQERCVGCEACIDTACGRDECPKGWPKAAQLEQEPVPAAMKTVIEAMQQDPDYAWGWHCNIAMSFVDAGGDHYTGNQGAARFMRTLANVEPAHELPFSPPQRTAAEGEDTRRAWVGLTDDEMRLIDPDGFEDNLPQMIQQALKEKNAK